MEIYMKAIFLCEQKEICFKVYDHDALSAICSSAQIEKKAYGRADVFADKEKFKDTEIIFSTWGMPALSAEEIKAYFPRLKCVFYAAGSVQYFARPFLECNVRVFSAWAANAVPVAEMTVAQIILANKGFFASSRLYGEGEYEASRSFFGSCPGNFGDTVGIIGAGMIGRLVIDMLKSYRLKVVVFDPFLPDEVAEELGVEKCSLEELFERSFVVSNHLANNAQTKGMLNYSLFERMRERAVFINTGRGAQVVEEDLSRILSERRDLTALLDVTQDEPIKDGHPFYSLKNCILTPHIAGSAGLEVARMGLYMQKEFETFLSGEKCKYEVSAKMLETMA